MLWYEVVSAEGCLLLEMLIGGKHLQTTQQENPQQLHLLPRRQLQLHHQRPRHSQNDDIGDQVQRRVHVVHDVLVYTIRIAGVDHPVGGDGRALEDGGEEEDEPPAEDEGGDAVGHEAEAAAGEEAVVEEEDGEFD